MKDEIVVKRYGDAFAKFAGEGFGIQNAVQDLKALKNVVIHDNPEFLGLLHSMEITVSEKSEFIDKVLSEGFSEETRQFLKLLLLKGRIDKIPDIIEYVRKKYSFGGSLVHRKVLC